MRLDEALAAAEAFARGAVRALRRERARLCPAGLGANGGLGLGIFALGLRRLAVVVTVVVATVVWW